MTNTRTQPKTYGTHDEVPEMRACVKRPITVRAKQINEAFRVKSMEGDYVQGKAGDYLMQGIDGELYICSRSVFERSYDFV